MVLLILLQFYLAIIRAIVNIYRYIGKKTKNRKVRFSSILLLYLTFLNYYR